MLLRNIALILVLSVVACRRPTNIVYSPPEQHFPSEADLLNKTFILMRDPAIADYLVQDIDQNLQADSWRWTFDRPELHFYLADIRNLALVFDFAIPEAKLKDTGTETVSFFVNGALLGSQTCAKAGSYKFSQAVPANWLKPASDVIVAAQVRPVWKDSDGRPLSLILTGAGFVQNAAAK